MFKRKTLKKALSLVLALIMCTTLCFPAFAINISEDKEVNPSYTVYWANSCGMTPEERDAAFDSYIQSRIEAFAGKTTNRGNLGYYETVYGLTTRESVSDWAGQDNLGFSFGPGGGVVYYMETGGPTVPVSITVGLTEWLSASVEIPLGQASRDFLTGMGCNVLGLHLVAKFTIKSM